MAICDGWDPEKMLDLYLHDYMVKKKMHKAASTFKEEANICDHSVEINTSEGFLYEWWSIFYDVYAIRQMEHQKEKPPEAPLQAMQMNGIDQQQNFHSMVPSLAMNQPIKSENFPSGNVSNNTMGFPAASLLADNFNENEHVGQSAMDFSPSLCSLGVNKINLTNSTPTSLSLPPEMFKQAQQRAVRDKINGISLGRTATLDPMPNGLLRDTFPALRPHDAGMSKVVNQVPLNGWPVNALNNQQQFQMLLSDSQQPLLAKALSYRLGKQAAEPGSYANFCGSNLMLTKSQVKGKDEQIMPPLIRTEEQQYRCGQPQQQLLNNGRKNNVKKNVRKKKAASRSRTGENPLDCIKAKEERSVDKSVSTFISHDGGNAKDFTFREVGCLHSSSGNLLCCDFSPDGKLLASAGHEKKVFIWNVETFDSVSPSEGHFSLISDIRFHPSSTIFATSSFDRTVKIWDAARPSKSLLNLLGHSEQVRSVDFHPRKVDLLCSCDTNNEIRLWNVKQSTCTRVFKGATKQVRFQPDSGKLLATASGNGVNLFDTETGSLKLSWKGHIKDVLSICWDHSGKYILSVSEDSARVWSTLSGGKCISGLNAIGKKFQSCIFHPGYDHLCIIGGYETLELWNPECKPTSTIPAHIGLVAALAGSSETKMVASASHDHFVKLWK
ncbi:Guanine nucleotide-binding protein, beta subunit [Trema orientale]|uniref:Guanine nucleotide-binding protein, beta subunit n=1 Tax=Trema orientale TaxID=63057 RepID=A0A2P5CK59_TREOI|nr:Guanine nucleotide-binding protein, beta subunit [Trema orientale]